MAPVNILNIVKTLPELCYAMLLYGNKSKPLDPALASLTFSLICKSRRLTQWWPLSICLSLATGTYSRRAQPAAHLTHIGGESDRGARPPCWPAAGPPTLRLGGVGASSQAAAPSGPSSHVYTPHRGSHTTSPSFSAGAHRDRAMLHAGYGFSLISFEVSVSCFPP